MDLELFRRLQPVKGKEEMSKQRKPFGRRGTTHEGENQVMSKLSSFFYSMASAIEILTERPRPVKAKPKDFEFIPTNKNIKRTSLGVYRTLDASQLHRLEVQVFRPFTVDHIEVLEPGWNLHSISYAGREHMPNVGEDYRCPVASWDGDLPTIDAVAPLFLTVSHEDRAPDAGTKLFSTVLHGKQLFS